MSPDIEWHVGEDEEQETIARITRPLRSRRRVWVLISAIGLGVSLGLLYRSIPEPPARPIGSTPTPVVIPTPLPPRPLAEPLETTIQHDAQRLASLSAGGRISFDPSVSHLPQAFADWYAALQNVPGGWGPITPLTPYTIFETGTLASGVVWVKLGQFRHGDFYRQTRFYRWRSDHWVWTLPDLEFWKGATAVVMTGDAGLIGPISIGHPTEEVPVISAVFDRFTRAYVNLCESLGCPPPTDRTRLWTPGLTLSMSIQPLLMEPYVQERGGTLNIGLPSPRVVGYIEDPNGPGDPFTAMAYDTLIEPVARLASGDRARWESDRSGELFLQAIVEWKRAQIRAELHPSELFFTSGVSGQSIWRREDLAAALQGEPLVPLDTLWDWPTQGRGFGLLQHVAVNEVQAVVVFVEKQYGGAGVVRFLNALGRSQSLEEAIETALPLSIGEFQRAWKQWIFEE